MELNGEEVFKICARAMRLNGSHPEIKRDLKWLIHFLLGLGPTFVILPIVMNNIFFLNLKDGDFSEACKNCTFVLVDIAGAFHYSIMLWKQQYMMDLINNVKQDYAAAALLPLKEQEIIEEYARKGANVCKLWLYVSCITLGIFPAKNILMHIYNWVIGEFRLIPPYDLVYPSIIEEKKDDLFVYLIVYIVLLFYGSYSAVMITSFMPLGPGFMLHACGQLEVVIYRTKVLFINDGKNVRNKLKDIVLKMQNIYAFVEKINLSFCIAYEISLKATTILLPITGYQILESLNHGEVSLEFITFFFGGLLISSSTCYYGELLMEKGETLRLSMYSCGWENVYDFSIRSTIKIMLMHALRPVAIRTLFRTVSLEALTELSNQAFAIFNLMNAVLK